MIKENFNSKEVVSISRFLNEYVLPLYGQKLDESSIKSMEKLSHLDLDELNISCVQRCSDEYAMKDPDIILVGGFGMYHQGYEVHGYYRPFNLRKKELLDEGYEESEVNHMLISALPVYCEQDFNYIDEMNKQKRKERKKESKRKYKW